MKGYKKRRIASFLLAAVMLVVSVPMYSAVRADESLSVDVNCPFTSTVPIVTPDGSVTSNSYRIPSMVTLADGTIIAAADVRWNTTYDGGCLDTLVARSSDGGVSWEYTLANYLGDNGNTYSGSSSTAFIDPCLTVAADGQTVYMLVDLYPYGVALNGSGNTQPTTAVGFTSDGYLKLSGNSHYTYGYYLKDGKIYSTGGTAQSGYTVDEYFNLYYNGSLTSNLFYSDSPFKVVRTGFLYLTSSTDGGKSWSAPTLLDLKTSTENVCLVGPGRGITIADGTMIFPVYSYGGSTDSQRLGFICSKDGVTWERVQSSVAWSSESAVVEIGEGTLRFFYRNGSSRLYYVDYDMGTSSWKNPVNTGVATNSNTQLSAVTYSRTSDGKQVVLVSCPTGPAAAGSNNNNGGYRLNGRIFAGLVGADGTMVWSEAVNVTGNTASAADTTSPYTEAEGFFAYSCLTERADGSVAVLYENRENAWGAGSSCYYSMNMKAYSSDELGLTFDVDSGESESSSESQRPSESSSAQEPDPDPTPEPELITQNVFVPVNGTATVNGLTGEIDASALDASVATAEPSEGTLDSGSIVVTGLKVGMTSVTVGDVKLNIYVNPENTQNTDADKALAIHVDNIENCTVYYAINGGPLYEIEEGVDLINQTYRDGFNIMFFASPDDGYVLTQMSVTNSDDQYYCLSDGEYGYEDGSDSSAWPFDNADQTTIPTTGGHDDWVAGHGFRWSLLEGNMTIAGMRDLFTRALDKEADGATTFTKNGSGGLTTSVSFLAEKLPTLEKTITSLNGGAYTEGTTLEFGDVITYQFKVTTYSENVSYTGVTLTDTLIGYSKTISDNVLDTPGEYTYTARYTVTEGDIDNYANGTFVNNAKLSYTYGSNYSSGMYDFSATASVSCDINGIVCYVWMDGLPEGITEDSASYPLYAPETVKYGRQITVKGYNGLDEYSVTDPAGFVTGTWTFSHWEYNGTRYDGGSTLRMPSNDSVELVGIWSYLPAATYSVSYEWGAFPEDAVLPTDDGAYYEGQRYAVDGTYHSSSEIDDGAYIWRFSGWMLNGAAVSGEQIMGGADITLTGEWTAERKFTSLTITKLCDVSADDGQVFVFDVYHEGIIILTVSVVGGGSVTVDGLSVGATYSVVENTDWSWRYTPDSTSKSITLTADGDSSVSFSNTRTEDQWLDCNANADNLFKENGVTNGYNVNRSNEITD